MQSKQEAEQFREWEKQEDQFHLRQCSLRSKIRIQEGRGESARRRRRGSGGDGDDLM